PAPAPAPEGDAGKTRIVKVGLAPASGVVGVLIGVDGKLRDEVFKVFDGENTLGRRSDAEVYLGERDDSISRDHAQIIHREGAFGLRPLKDDNPTFLNGDRVEGGAPLSDGDEVGIGDSKLRFRVV
ncbi:MAG: FHA domain-containing protein, partial [Deltaproteobacteria bacterium]|nr:FHA domain-containing protein [Deltaproteobacteria bacterium]